MHGWQRCLLQYVLARVKRDSAANLGAPRLAVSVGEATAVNFHPAFAVPVLVAAFLGAVGLAHCCFAIIVDDVIRRKVRIGFTELWRPTTDLVVLALYAALYPQITV